MNFSDFGLEERDQLHLVDVFKEYTEVEKVMLFGSRATGSYKSGSDIDLALVGSNLIPNIVRSISIELNENRPIPFFVDVLDYTHLSKPELKAHIDLFGVVVYDSEL